MDRLPTIALVLAVLTLSAQSRAQDESNTLDDAARAAFSAGEQAFAAGDFEDALRAFSSGYELSSRHAFLFNIGACHERLHDLPEAIDFYERYLVELPDASNRELVESRLVRLRALTADPEQHDSRNVPALVAASIGGVGVVMFAVGAPLALASHNELADCRPTATCGDRGDQGRRRALVADIGLGVAVVGGITGLVLWLVGRGDDEDETRVTPHVDSTRAALFVEGRF